MHFSSTFSFFLFVAQAFAWPTPTSFTPEGGVGTNASAGPPEYRAFSDFDWQSLNLALNQEWIELDLFHHGLAQFSSAEFEAAGLSAQDRYLIQFMAEQEVGHAKLISDMLGPNAAKPCNYTYPFQTVREFVDFCQKLTRWGEAGVYGFLPHLDSRAAASLLLQSITTEARQQMIFRQFEGLFPMPIWFLPGVPQAFAWTLLSPYLKSCPAENPRIDWQIFPALAVVNNPSAISFNNSSRPGYDTSPAITQNRTVPLSSPGREVFLMWEIPGRRTSYNSSYTTFSSAGSPRYAAWVSQLNTTYTLLDNINGTSATTVQPEALIFGSDTAPLINGTMFIAITDSDPYVTPFNLSEINSHIVAGPAMYQAG